MAIGDQDAAVFLNSADFAVEATLADGTKANVIHQSPEDVQNFGGLSMPGALAGKPTMVYETGGAFAGKIAHGIAVVIAGKGNFTVAGAPRVLDDGLFSIAELHKSKVA